MKKKTKSSDPKLMLIPIYVSSDPPLGLGSIATYLKEYSNFTNTLIVDAPFDEAIDFAKKLSPEIIGLSAMTIHYSRAIRFAQKIKETKELKNSIVILGGVHISTLPESLDQVFDLAVIGEGEETMLELVNLFRSKGKNFSNKDLRNIRGLAFYENKKVFQTLRRPLIDPLDKIPVIDRDFFSQRYFEKSILETKKAVRLSGVLTSRGCPYKCRFCSTSLFWNRIRFHSVKHVVDEIEYLMKHKNIDFISIWDDLFFVDKRRIREMIKEMRQRKLLGKVKFNATARANLVDDELCQLGKELGVVYFNFGFESGSDRMIKYLKKESVGYEDNKRAVILCKKYNICVGAAFIIGSPTETEQDIRATINFIKFMKKYSNVDLVWMSIMSPLPGTEMWEIAKKRGKVSNQMKNWSIFSEYSLEGPMLLDESLSREKFMELFKEARANIRYFELRLWFKRFLNNPFYVGWLAIKDLKFLKFFTLTRAEGKEELRD
ncbi:MAG: radical SAM protein [Nanoarchaeota archaeon]|nr:radical SAM protein [Nanoarchaeota archaeon]